MKKAGPMGPAFLCCREITSSRLSFLRAQAQQPEQQPERQPQLWALQPEQEPGPERVPEREQGPERAPGRVFRHRRSNR